ncbi:MAG: acetylornithine deacetylase [Gaiellaceae bacterium]|nr:acetylornithine deacetylase [Gaiellaceae bacterium]
MTGGAFAQIDAYVEAHRDELVGLVQALVRFDTTSVDLAPGSDHTSNDEAAAQAFIAEELRASGLEIDQWEPDRRELKTHPMMPPWHHFEGRPITVGRLRGTGHGRSLIVNGHIDVVSAGDVDRWTTPPFAAEVVDGRLTGRGACDMKGGIGAALFALRALHACGLSPEGDVFFEAVTDEETCAMGTIAACVRGYRADAGLVPEPTNFDLWIATRGILHATCSVTGRSAHAEMNQPSWQEGGGVNAISKTARVIEALEELAESWTGREDKVHPLLGVPGIHPTLIRGGAFISNVPEQCELALNSTYLPGNADAAGFGSAPKAEIEAAIAGLAADDEWLAANPPRVTWLTDYPPSEIDTSAPVIDIVREVSGPLGIEPRLGAIDTAYDGALLTIFADTPSPAWGPGDLTLAHAPDESIDVDELALAARLYARAILTWCGHGHD